MLVNPTTTTRTINLGGTFYRVNPSGGGFVPANGVAPGSLSYTAVTSVTLNPNRAVVLLNALP
jgi:hypothetical protein